jgi:hypothetical protein
MAKNAQTLKIKDLSPDELKNAVRDGLVSMTISDRIGFIEALESELRKLDLNIRAYLVPLGIPGRSAEDLTPNEVGHLVRFLKINVPKAIPAIERAMSRYSAFAEKSGKVGSRLAA